MSLSRLSFIPWRKGRVVARKIKTSVSGGIKKIIGSSVQPQPTTKKASKSTPQVSTIPHTNPKILPKTIFIALFAVLSVLLFAATLRGVSGNPTAAQIKDKLDERSQPFELSPERGRYVIIMSLSDQKSFALSADLRDIAYPDVGYIDGRYYSFFAPGISLLALPFYEAGKVFNLAQVASYSMISLFALLNMLVIYKVSRNVFRLPFWASLFAAVVFAFASTSWSYANTLYQHHLTTFFIMSSFYAVWKFSKQKRFSPLWAGFVWLNYALAIFIDYPNAILMFPVMVYLLIETIKVTKEKKQTFLSIRLWPIATITIFFLITAVHGYYNYVNFGSPAKVSGSLIGYKAVKDFKLLESPKGIEELHRIEGLKQPVKFFQENNLPRGVYTLLAASDKGIFFFSPIFILALFNLIYVLPILDRRYGVLFAVVGVNVFLYSSFGDPWGGFAFGPRYLIPTMAILSIFVAEWLVRTRWKILSRSLALLLFLYSAAIALVGTITTNSVPPGVEAVALKAHDNFLLNIEIWQKGVSSSYLYNTFLAQVITLQWYSFILFFLVAFMGIVSLFYLPYLKNHED